MNKSTIKSKNPIIPFIYYLNNVFYILEFSRNKDSESNFDFESGQTIEKSYERMCLEYIKTIFPDINQLLATDIQLNYEKDGKLQKSSKNTIKKRFSVFIYFVSHFRISTQKLMIFKNIIKIYGS